MWLIKELTFINSSGGEDDTNNLSEFHSHGWVHMLIELSLPNLHLMPSFTKACEMWILCHVLLELCLRGASRNTQLEKYLDLNLFVTIALGLVVNFQPYFPSTDRLKP